MEEIRDKVIRNDFEIKNVEVFSLNIPLKKPIKMSGITVQNAENIIVKITSNNLRVTTATATWHNANEIEQFLPCIS